MPYIGNQHNVGDHVNNFKVLDDISSHTATFDGSASSVISTTNETIRIPEHRFIQGQRVTYNNGGGGNIGGLTSGTAYFVTFDTPNTIKLATTLSNANSNTNINLSSVGSGTSHTLNAAFDNVNTKFKITYNSGTPARLNNATQLNIAINNVIQRPNQNVLTFTEGFAIEDGHKIVFKNAPTSNDIFWGSIIANTIENFDLRDNEVDNFTGDGSTTEFTLSTIPANNESVMVSLDGVLQHPSDKDTARAYTLLDSIIQFTAAPGIGVEIQVRHIGFAGPSTNDVSGFYGRTGNVVLTDQDDITVNKINVGTGVTIESNGQATFVGVVTFGSGSTTIDNNVVNVGTALTLGHTQGLQFHTQNLHSTGFEINQINASGIITASSLDISGNASIGGVLTYEDVTSIDAVGIITARDGLKVLAGGANVVGVVTATTFKGDGDFVELDVDGHTNLDNVSIAGVTTCSDQLNMLDNKIIRLGSAAASRTSIYYDSSGSNTWIKNFNDTLKIGYRPVEIYYINQKRLEFMNGGNRFTTDVTTTFLGDNYHASWSPSSNKFQLNDNAKLAFGSQSDSEFYHNGSNLYLQNDTGHIYIQNNVAADVDKNIYIQAKNGENSITCENDGEVYLFSNQVSANQQKLRTSNTGIYVTGIGTFTDKVSVIGSQNSMLTNNQLIFDRAGTSYIDNTNNSGSLSFRIGSSYTVGLFIDSSANVSIPSKLMHHGDTDTFLEFSSNTINFDTAGSERLRITSDGRIGINETSPDNTLHITKDSSNHGIKLERTGTNAGFATINCNSFGALALTAGNNLSLYSGGSQQIMFNRGASTEIARFDTGGRLLIGTTTATGAAKLQLLQSSGDGLLVRNHDTNYEGIILSNASGEARLMATSGGSTARPPLTFFAGDAERLRIKADGNLMMGNSANPGNTLRYFDVYNTNTGTSAGAILRLLTTKSDGSSTVGLDIVKYKAGGAYIINNENVGADTGFIAFNTGSSGVAPATHLRVAGNGEVVVSPRNGGASNNRTSIHFNNAAHTPFIAFKSNNVTEAAYIKAGESSGGCDLEFQTKNTSGTLLSRLTLKNGGEIFTHQLAGGQKGYPLIMGTGTVANNTNMSGSINMHDINGVHTTGGPNYHIGGWVYLGTDQAAHPYPVRRFKIFAPNAFSNGTIVYQVWHDGDANYYYGGLWEIRLNLWTDGDIESVTLRCINGFRDDLRVFAYNDSNGIMIQTSSIWGRVFIRRFGYDDGGRNPGSSYCAVANNGALAIYNSSGTDNGTPPTSGSPVELYPFDGTSGSASSTHTGGYSIENAAYFDG